MSTSSAFSVAVSQLLWTVLLPVGITLLGTFAVSSRAWRSNLSSLFAAVVVGTAVVASAIGIGGYSFPPVEALHTLPFVLVMGAVVGLPSSRLLAVVGRFGAFAIAVAFTLRTLAESDVFGFASAVVAGGIGAALIPRLWSESQDRERRQGPWVFLSLGAALGGLALVLLLSGSAKLGQISGVASLVALTIAALEMRNRSTSHALPSALVLFAALLSLGVQGWFYVETPAIGVLAPLLVLGLPVLTSRPQIAKLPLTKTLALALVVLTIPVAIGVGAAWLDQPPPDPYGAVY